MRDIWDIIRGMVVGDCRGLTSLALLDLHILVQFMSAFLLL